MNFNPKMTGMFAATAFCAFATTGALSADLGGNCCADLEERISELEATTARKGNTKQTLTVYGQVNKAILHFKLDDDSDTRVIDNPLSGSRFGFKGSSKINKDLEIGFKLELGVSENGDSDTFSVRQSNVYAKGSFGTLTIGEQDFASSGAAEVNLASTPSSTLLSLGPIDSVYFGGSVSPYDGGNGRAVRYDSPTIGGFVVSASWGAARLPGGIDEDDTYDVALRYANEFGGLRVAGAIAYRDEGDETAKIGSASVMHMKSGAFISGSIGAYDFGPDTLETWHLMGGMESKWNSLGKSTLYVEYSDTKDLDLTFWGVGFTQSIDAAATELYAGARMYDADGEDAFSLLAGVKTRF